MQEMQPLIPNKIVYADLFLNIPGRYQTPCKRLVVAEARLEKGTKRGVDCSSCTRDGPGGSDGADGAGRWCAYCAFN